MNFRWYLGVDFYSESTYIRENAVYMYTIVPEAELVKIRQYSLRLKVLLYLYVSIFTATIHD